MKLHPEDPRLTAFLLGELSVEEAKEIEQAIADDPALQEASRELEQVRQFLVRDLATLPGKLNPEQRDRILSEARSRDQGFKSAPGKSPVRWIVPLAAAAAITVGLFLFLASQQHPVPTPASVSSKETEKPSPSRVHLSPAPGPADASAKSLAANTRPAGSHPTLPPLLTRGYVAASEFPTIELPVQSGKSSLEWIRQAILTRHERPAHEEIRVEEILNSFNLRPAGVTVVSRLPAAGWHPDDRSSGQTSHAATIAAESLACPWKPSATIVIISVRGNPNTDCNIKAVFRANSENVSRYRLLGFSNPVGEPDEPMPSLLPAKGSNTVAIEIEPKGTATALGEIQWSVNDQPAAAVPMNRHGSSEPSDDARFAALICTYAQWLANDPKGLVDIEVLAALARETASDSLSGDRVEFLHLIDQSLGL